MIIVTGASLLPDAIDFLLQREAIERRQRKREKETDPAVENKKRVAKSAFDFSGVSLHGSRVGNSPVCGHGLSRPQRAGFLGGIVANREDEVHFGSARSPEFVPALAAQASGRDTSHFQLLQRFGTNRSRRMTSSAVGRESAPSFVVEDCLRHDRPSRVSRAQK